MSTGRYPLAPELVLRLRVAALEYEKQQLQAQVLCHQMQALLEQARLAQELAMLRLLGCLQDQLPVPLETCTVDLAAGCLSYEMPTDPPSGS